MVSSCCSLHAITGFEKWLKLGAPSPLLSALRDMGFTVPTEIQELAIPPAIKEDKDVIGAAETVCVCVCMSTCTQTVPVHLVLDL